MRVKLSSIWSRIHTRIYTKQPSAQFSWSETLPELDNDLEAWSQLMSTIKPRDSLVTLRAEKKQFEVINLAQAIMRIIMHRSFLIQTPASPSPHHLAQRQRSTSALSSSACQVVTNTRRLMELGTHNSFWFLSSDLQIACLALFEVIQNLSAQNSSVAADEKTRACAALQDAIAILGDIRDSGQNPLAAQVLQTVTTLQDAQSLQDLAKPTEADHYDASGHRLLPAGLSELSNSDPQADSLPSFAPEDPMERLMGRWDPISGDAFGVPGNDLDWLKSLCSIDSTDTFVASAAPAAQDLSWWLNPQV